MNYLKIANILLGEALPLPTTEDGTFLRIRG